MKQFMTVGARRFGFACVALALLAGCEPADERAQEHLQSGLKLAESGDNARALLEFREAVRLNENLTEAYNAIGRIREAEGNMQSAVGHYLKAIESDESNVEARIRLGRIMSAAGQLDEALKYAMAAAQLAPDNVDALTLRAKVGVQVENYDLAAESAQKALALDPNSAEAEIVLAAISERKGDKAAARARIDGALNRSPDNLALNLFKLRLLAANKEDQDQIPVILERLARLNPQNDQFHIGLVRWHVSKNQIDEAEKAVRAYAAAKPESVKAALAVVSFLQQRRSVEAARAELNRQIAARGDAPEAFEFEMALVRLELADGKTEDAIEKLNGMIAKYGDTANGDAARVGLAELEIRRGQPEAAMALAEAVLKHDARNAKALALRAQLKLADGRYDSAVQDIRLALAEDPENWRYLMLEARAHELNGARSLVGERLGAAAQVSSYDPVPVLAYAEFLRTDGKADFAEGLIENALRRHPNHAALLRALAQLKLQRKDWIGAEDVARQLRQVAGGAATADLVAAQSLAGQKQYEQSIEVLEGALKRDGETGSNMAALVASYVRSGQEDRARAFLDDVLATTPDNLSALRLKADLLTTLDEKVEAEKIYREIVALRPTLPAAHAALAEFLIREDRTDEALAAARAGVEASGGQIEGGGAGLQLSYALLLEQKADYDGAVKVYEKLAAERPDSFIVANNLASLLVDRFPTEANIERALQVAKRLRESEVPQYQDTYGWILYLRGEAEQALRYLQPAAEAMPNLMLAQYHLGMAYAKAGIEDRAITALNRSIELAGDDASLSEQVKTARATLETLQKSANKEN